MSKANKRTSISENVSETRLKEKLHENYKRFLNEADEDAPIDDAAIDDESLDLDADLEDDMANEDGDLTSDFDPMSELGDSEATQVENWVDEILGDSLEQVEDTDGLLDTEVDAGDLDPMGDNSQIHDDLPLTATDLDTIISDDDSLAELEAALAALATEDMDENMNDEGAESFETDEDLALLGESTDFDLLENELSDLNENEDPMKGVDEYFDKGFEGKDVKDELATTTTTPSPANKFKGIDTDPTISSVKATPGKAGADSNIDLIKESKKRAAMLVAAAKIIAKHESLIEAAKIKIHKLALDNYKLSRANGILSESAEVFSPESRIKIAEGFDKCSSKEQINKFYEGLVGKIKDSKKASLNEAVNTKKNNIKLIRESNNQDAEENLSIEQERINSLMGLPTKNDVYLS